MPLLTGSFRFDPAQSLAIQRDLREYSIIQQFARKVDMTEGGAYVQIFDTDVAGGWVAAEAGQKPVNEQVTTSTTVAKYEWATVIPVSNRIVKNNPFGVIDIIKKGAYRSMNRAFDKLAFEGEAGLGTSVADSLAGVTKTTSLQKGGLTAYPAGRVGDKGTWSGLNDGLKLLTDANKDWTGSLWDGRVEPVFNLDGDTTKRPLYVDVPLGDSFVGNRPGRVLSRPADFAKNVNAKLGALATADVVGYAGDWNRAVWGTVGDVSYAVSTEASWTSGGVQKSAFEYNVTLFRVEAVLGFKVLDTGAFVKFTLGDPLAA
jgi:HK97 family phage major capsid protein